MELVFDRRTESRDFDGDISALLKALGVMREEVIVKVNGKLAPETRRIGKADRVEIIKVVFGG